MVARKANERVNTQPFNWLDGLDREAATLPRATNWVEPYGPFMLARYTHLRPLPIPGNGHSQILCDSGEKTAAQRLAEWELRIAESNKAAVCLNGLGAGQRQQLAALVIETVCDLEMREADSRSARWASRVRKEAPARLRGLDRRLQKARLAIEELYAFARDSGTVGLDYRLAADKALKAMTMKCPPDAKEYAEVASEHPTPERVEVFGMVRLYWFFRYECDLSGHESELRTALLRNTFWSEYNIDEVPYRPEYEAGIHKGCDTVHVAVTRFRPS
jgi:hypothetical protein